MNPVEEVLELAQDGRTREALAALDDVLTQHDDGVLHALKAFLLADERRIVEARESAARAHELDPGNTYVLHAVGRVAIDAGEPDRAIAAARQLLAEDPYDSNAILLEARARALLGQWDEVRSRAEFVLGNDPQDVEAAFLRIAAIESKKNPGAKLDTAEWEALAERFPHVPVARAGKAWTLLNRGRARQAEQEFRDALALDPTNPWAREGLLLSLKSRYPGYGLLLRFFTWLQSLPPRTQTLVLVGGFVGSRVLRSIAERNPAVAPFVWPIIIVYLVFVLMTWLADPLLNLLLLTRAEGRRLLRDDERRGAIAVGLALGSGILLVALGAVTPWSELMIGGIVIAMSSLTFTTAYHCAPGRIRTRVLWTARAFVGCGILAAALASDATGVFAVVGILGTVIVTWTSRMIIRKSYEWQRR